MAPELGDSLLSVINYVLDLSKIEAGMLDLNLVKFHPRDSIDETVGALALSAHQKGLELGLRRRSVRARCGTGRRVAHSPDSAEPDQQCHQVYA